MSGPRRLGTLLAAWDANISRKAVSAKEGESAGALLAAWESAVGPAIARRSLPARFRNGVLTVLTASSAWSNELSYLTPTILDSLRRIVPQANVCKLRFTVATGRTRLLLDNGRPQRPLTEAAPKSVRTLDAFSTDQSEKEDLHAFARALAEDQKALNQWRDSNGWKQCESCGSRFWSAAQTASVCAPCTSKRRRTNEARIELAFMQAPWMSMSELRQALPGATEKMWRSTRQRLLTRWEGELGFAERRLRRGALTPQDRVTAWSYLMLVTGLPQRDIGRAAVRDVLGNVWTNALFSPLSA